MVKGRRVPDEDHPETVVYGMRIFAMNRVEAKSLFWYHIDIHYISLSSFICLSSSNIGNIQEKDQKLRNHLEKFFQSKK